MGSVIEMINHHCLGNGGIWGAARIFHKNQQHGDITYLFVCHDYSILVFNNTLLEVIVSLGFLALVGRKGKP